MLAVLMAEVANSERLGPIDDVFQWAQVGASELGLYGPIKNLVGKITGWKEGEAASPPSVGWGNMQEEAFNAVKAEHPDVFEGVSWLDMIRNDELAIQAVAYRLADARALAEDTATPSMRAAWGARVHLAHPLGVKGFAYRRVKNDERGASDLADLLRMGRLPEAWAAPPAARGLRELVRHRCKLVALRSGLKAQVHAVLAKQGVHVPVSDLFGVGGSQLLDQLKLDGPYHGRVGSLRRPIEAFTFEIDL